MFILKAIQRKNLMVPFIVLLLLLSYPGFTQEQKNIGINLGPSNDWSTAWVFVDRMKNARSWKPFPAGTYEWDSGVPIPSNSEGYPLEVPFDPDGAGSIPPQEVHTLLFRDVENYYPSGTYTLFFEGTGKIELSGDGNGEFTQANLPHHFEISSQSSTGLLLTIVESLKSDPVRNIRVIMPGFEDNYDKQIFHPLYLDRLSIFKVIRFGWWGQVWGSEVEDWSEVATPDYYTQARYSGVSPEYMIELCNRLGADPWIGIPHLANDQYIEELAQLVKAKLDVGRKVYIEYSNETWNGMMSDAQYVQDQGVALGLSSDPFRAGLFYYARKSAEIFQIFENVFNGTDRLVRVVGSQASNDWTGKQILAGLNDPIINPTSSRADVLAIAPYFGGSIADNIVANGEVNTISVNEILNRLETSVYTETEIWTRKNYELSKEYGVDLIAYEGGPHLVANTQNRENETLVDKLTEASRNPRMTDILLRMFDVWFTNGGTLFTGFDFIDYPSKYGCFGIIEYQNQPISDAPKYLAYKQVYPNGYIKYLLVPKGIRIK